MCLIGQPPISSREEQYIAIQPPDCLGPASTDTKDLSLAFTRMCRTVFKRRLMAFVLLCAVAIAAYEDSPSNTQIFSSQEDVSVSDPSTSAELHSDPSITSYSNDFGHRITTRSINRPARSVQNSGTRRTCNTISYHFESQIGHHASCPFDWIVNFEGRRIPERIVEQVCRNCRSCGHNRYCAQLKVRYQVYFRDTAEYSQLEVRAGCACMPIEVGSTANPYDVVI